MSEIVDHGGADVETRPSSEAIPRKGKPWSGTIEQSGASSDAPAIELPPLQLESGRAASTEEHQARKRGFRAFRTLCDSIRGELLEVEKHLEDDEVGEGGLLNILAIENLLDELFDSDWGEGEYLQRVAVALESQVKNTQWTKAHVAFLIDAINFIRTRYVIDEYVVDQCYELMKIHGLDRFRGTTSAATSYEFAERHAEN